MARRKPGRRYTAAQKAAVIRRVQGGETQAAVAKEAGISAWTVGQCVNAEVLCPQITGLRSPLFTGHDVPWGRDG
jgi:hypothetical protein